MPYRYYDAIAESYDELHRKEQEKKVNLILKKLDYQPEDHLLDVGCGTGISAEKIPCKKIGLDPSEKMLEKCDFPVKKARAENIPFEEDSFDIVISLTAIQNFDDIKKGLEEIKRVGKGKFVLSFLKKSRKTDTIDNMIKDIFKVQEILEEEKDLIYFCTDQNEQESF